jgi:tRNA (guanine37-N1)-methyltransferase
MHNAMKKKRTTRKPLRFEAITIFPDAFADYMNASILGRAHKKKLISFKAHDLRDWTHDKHRTVDDKPFGGGPGMLMKPQPFLEALVSLGVRRKKDGRPTAKAKKTRVIVTAANGKQFTHKDAVRLSKYDRLIFLCGRYEGIDQRVIDRLADESLTIGPYVLTGGELPAMVMMDAISRHIPGVLGKEASLEEESWSDSGRLSAVGHGLRAKKAKPKAQSPKPGCTAPDSVPARGTGEYPQYTRPEVWLGMKVPPVLMSGHHKKIEEWRKGKRKRW